MRGRCDNWRSARSSGGINLTNGDEAIVDAGQDRQGISEASMFARYIMKGPLLSPSDAFKTIGEGGEECVDKQLLFNVTGVPRCLQRA